MAVQKLKLIEVALSLRLMSQESGRERSIRHGHPSTLHLAVDTFATSCADVVEECRAANTVCQDSAQCALKLNGDDS